MCGIWALLGIDPTDLNIYEACNKLRPRGPDAFRMEFHKSITNGVICFQRLEIIDSIYGMQPMKLHRYPHIILICNGEIYNWTQLKGQYNYQYETECDVEAVIHLYMQYENDCAAILDAEFAFAIFDVKKKRLLLARDPYGVRPLYHLRTAEENGSIGLGISSEAKGLMDVSRVLTKRGIEHSLEQFPPSMYAEYSILDSGRLKLNTFKRYFEYLEKPRFKTLVPYYALHDKDVEANIRTLLMSAVEKRLMGDRRIGCLLSGGLDSSLIAALTVRLAKMAKLNFSIQTFSIGMSGQSPDIVCARKVADFIGSEHHEILFTEQDVRDALDTVIRTIETYDITTIRASLGMYLLSKYVKTKSDTTVLLSGEGADELAQGYIYFREAPNVTDANAESLRLLKDIYLYDGLRADRTTATHGLELRLPFLDLQFTSYFLNLPAESRTPQKGVEKYLLRHAFNDSNLLPAEILWRHKEAFSDGVANHERSLFSIIQEFTASQISDEDMKQAKNVYPFNTPPTKEAFYYRKIFEEEFGPHERLTPYMWMPKWVEAKDPSARVLKSYSKDAVCCK